MVTQQQVLLLARTNALAKSMKMQDMWQMPGTNGSPQKPTLLKMQPTTTSETVCAHLPSYGREIMKHFVCWCRVANAECGEHSGTPATALKRNPLLCIRESKRSECLKQAGQEPWEFPCAPTHRYPSSSMIHQDVVQSFVFTSGRHFSRHWRAKTWRRRIWTCPGCPTIWLSMVAYRPGPWALTGQRDWIGAGGILGYFGGLGG